jgi:autotransporter-associated beta strand protein
MDPAVAVKYGKLVQCAYEMYDLHPTELNPPPGPSFPKDEYLLGWTIQMTDFFWSSNKREFYGFMAQSKSDPNEIVIALRGTRTWREWWDDLHFIEKVPCHFCGSAGRVAQGFMEIYKTLGAMPSAGESGPKPLREVLFDLASPPPALKLILAGHSLGGALVTLLALDWRCKDEANPTIYTFASPRVGDVQFATKFDTMISTSYRTWNYRDEITYLPPEIIGYKHVSGPGYMIDSYGQVRDIPTCNHYLNSYLYVLSNHQVPLDKDCKPWRRGKKKAEERPTATKSTSRRSTPSRKAGQYSGCRGNSVISAVVTLVVALLAAVAPWLVLAATRTMTGGGGCVEGAGWTTTGCWQESVVPTTGDDVVMNGAGLSAETNYNLGSGVQLHSITLMRANNNVNITGGPIVLQSGGFITDGFCNGGTNIFPGVTLNGPATFTRDGCTFGMNPSTLSINGAVTGTGPLTLVNNLGNDNLRLTVASAYTGATTVNGTARVRFDVNGAVPTGSALTVNGSALFMTSSTIGSLAGGGTVFMDGNNTLTAGGDDTSTTFSGVYQNSGGSAALTKTGTGTLTLSGANTYTGATTVNVGTLAVNGSLVSPVTVQSGGTLGGTGTITNTVTVQSGGTLSPGTSPGIIDTGDLTLDSGSTLTIEMNGPTVGTQYDQVNVTGTVDLGGATLNVVLGFIPSGGQVFTIINNDGVDPVMGTFAGLPEGATVTKGGSRFRISYVGGTGNDVTLTLVQSPTFFTLQGNGLCLTLDLVARQYKFKTPRGTFTGQLLFGQRGNLLSFRNGPAEGRLLRGWINLSTGTASAALVFPLSSGGGRFIINDNIANNAPCL